MKSVLALDLATKMGWAFGSLESPKPFSGVIVLPAVDRGAQMLTAWNEISRLIQFHQPDEVVVEAINQVQTLQSGAAVEVLVGLSVVTQMACAHAEVPFFRVASTTIRSKILGTSKFPKGKAKEAVAAHLAAVGITTADHNAADAVMAWLYWKWKTNAG